MATLVCFHAHPDDEAIATGGTMAKAAAEGHRVVLVVATNGEHGEPVPGVLAPGESLADRREAETRRSAEILGVDRVEFLGYRDSGMDGEATNNHAGSFWSADVDEAAERLAAILREERRNDDATVLTVYDDHGGYGHPDHVQVHRVGTRAAELVGLDRVFWATMNRDAIRRQMEANPDMLAAIDQDGDELIDTETFGTAEAEITHAVDVRAHIDAKRSAMGAHASQIGDDSFFMMMPPEVFAEAFGTEWYVRPGTAREGAFAGELFERR